MLIQGILPTSWQVIKRRNHPKGNTWRAVQMAEFECTYPLSSMHMKELESSLGIHASISLSNHGPLWGSQSGISVVPSSPFAGWQLNGRTQKGRRGWPGDRRKQGWLPCLRALSSRLWRKGRLHQTPVLASFTGSRFHRRRGRREERGIGNSRQKIICKCILLVKS